MQRTMQVTHPRGFVTQYKYKDKIFEDTLVPPPNTQRVKDNLAKEAFVKDDGTVVIRSKTHKQLEPAASVPHIETRKDVSRLMAGSLSNNRSGVEGDISSSKNALPRSHPSRTNTAKQEVVAGQNTSINNTQHISKDQNIHGSEDKKLRKVQSASFCGAAGAQVRDKNGLVSWCPGRYVPSYLDAAPFCSVIHPEYVTGAPYQRQKVRLNHRPEEHGFLRHIKKNTRPFFLQKGLHYPVEPPRTFFDHTKKSNDFGLTKQNVTKPTTAPMKSEEDFEGKAYLQPTGNSQGDKMRFRFKLKSQQQASRREHNPNNL